MPTAQPSASRWRRVINVDVAPLRESRPFRIIFGAGTISTLGSMVTYVALPYQLKVLTGSYLAVGILGLIELAPLIAAGLWGGVLADTVNRRTMALCTEALMGFASIVLLVNALTAHPSTLVIYAAAVLFAIGDGLQRPSLDAMIQQVVAFEQLGPAASLSIINRTSAGIIGPALGGILAVTVGVGACYFIDATSFVVSLCFLFSLPRLVASKDAPPPSWKGLIEGISYATSRGDLLGTYLIDIAAMLFAFPVALLPFVAASFHNSAALGLLYAALPFGAMVASLTSGWTTRIHHHGRAIAIAATLWGLAIVGFGLSSSLVLALVTLALAGAADAVSGIFRSLIWNQTIPDELRGRLAGIELLSYTSGPQLGQLRGSLVAGATDLTTSLVSGGILCVVASMSLLGVLPSLRSYDDRTSSDAAAQRERRGDAAGENDRGDGGSRGNGAAHEST